MKFDTTKRIEEYLLNKYNKSVISKKEYANETGSSVSTVDNYIAKNEGVAKYVKLGSSKSAKIVFPIIEVAKFLSDTVDANKYTDSREQSMGNKGAKNEL